MLQNKVIRQTNSAPHSQRRADVAEGLTPHKKITVTATSDDGTKRTSRPAAQPSLSPIAAISARRSAGPSVAAV